jgi:DNA end-binding protein Ku
MLEFASHIARIRQGHFDPKKFDDRYDSALRALLKKKQAGEEIKPVKQREPAKVIDLMDLLRKIQESGSRVASKMHAPQSSVPSAEQPSRAAWGMRRQTG